MWNDVAQVERDLSHAGYLPSREIATSVFLSDRLEKPILVEGPAGVGKTELAKAIGAAQGRTLIRLQCYEGLDESKALYEWEYAKQLLYTQLLKDKIAEATAGAQTLQEAADRIGQSEAVFFSRRFLLPRPLLAALTSAQPAVLLIDEIDKADPEFEAFLLEVLSDFAVTVPELGTIAAPRDRLPRVVLTSNNSRELSDALKRRCVHLFIDFPTVERELAIVRARLPEVPAKLASAVAKAVSRLRTFDLKKPPSISESLDWARALVILNADTLSPELVGETLNLVLKYESDIARAKEKRAEISAAATAE
jgi:MoxR-like ATPase